MLIETQMRTKMFHAAMKATSAPKASEKRSIINAVAASMDTGAGVRKVKDWNAHLSMQTYNRLKVQGVMA